MVNYIKLFGIAAINFFTFVSFIITLCTKSENKKFLCYIHLLFWIIFNFTIILVAVLPELNKINVIY